ncbi:D-2-hydroxyacid dehydrogenase [Verticiella sediminum]|uniref:D-2-hydroxyacid dehydrogenase n=1 Tax=Verticiella sediminum TaxID=1247510 RepID=A0A556AJR0_9BURK|nr:D-2-hydroxyacid dehydrogenase [Verticiella sediminum]TSH93095.1 D-2-hydroxyacid dehydrogenase [Verticiella sediminum]
MTHNDPLHVVFLDRATIPSDIPLKPFGFPNTYLEHDRTRPDEVAARIADADVVIVNKVRIDAAALDAAPRLRMIAVAATGTDNVDLAACSERGIVVSNVRGYAGRSVPEHTFALIFALRRNLLAYRDAVGGGRWEQSGQFCFHDYPIRDLGGSTLGIIGDGDLGQSVGRIGAALDMRVVYAEHGVRHAPQAEYLPLEDLLRQSDVITLHVPLRPETQHLIDAPQFALMERRPLLINTARGGLVNEHALDTALRSGRIAGAGFDVASAEPLPEGHVLMRLTELPQFLLTPHIAWASDQAIRALADQVVENVEAFHRGSPLRTVAPRR